MKKLLSIAIIILVSSIWTISNAQVVGGFKMGVDFSNLKWESEGLSVNDQIDSKLLISPRLGFILEVGVIDELFVQTGVFGAIKGFRYKSSRTIDKNTENEKEYESREFEILGGLDIPLNVGYKFDLGKIKIIGMAGAVFSYNLYTTNLYYADSEWDNDKQTIGNNVDDTFRAFNIGLNIEGGIEFDRYQFTAFNTFGLSDLSTSDSSDDSIKTRVFGFTAAIKFGKVN